MGSGDASRIVQCNLGIFDSFRLLSIKNVVRHYVHEVPTIRFDLIKMQLLAMAVFYEIKSSELI